MNSNPSDSKAGHKHHEDDGEVVQRTDVLCPLDENSFNDVQVTVSENEAPVEHGEVENNPLVTNLKDAEHENGNHTESLDNPVSAQHEFQNHGKPVVRDQVDEEKAEERCENAEKKQFPPGVTSKQPSFADILNTTFRRETPCGEDFTLIVQEIQKVSGREYNQRVEQLFDQIENVGGLVSFLSSDFGQVLFAQLIRNEQKRYTSTHCWYSNSRKHNNNRRTTLVFDRVVQTFFLFIDDLGQAPDFVNQICSLNWSRFLNIIDLKREVSEFVNGGIYSSQFSRYTNYVMSFETMKHDDVHATFCEPLCSLSHSSICSLILSLQGAQFVTYVVDTFLAVSNVVLDDRSCFDHRAFWETVCKCNIFGVVQAPSLDEHQPVIEKCLETLVRCAPPSFQKQIVANFGDTGPFSGNFRAEMESYRLMWSRSQVLLEAEVTSDMCHKMSRDWDVDDLKRWLQNTNWGSLTRRAIAIIEQEIDESCDIVDIQAFLSVDNGKCDRLHKNFTSQLQWRKFSSKVKSLKDSEISILSVLESGVPNVTVDLPFRSKPQHDEKENSEENQEGELKATDSISSRILSHTPELLKLSGRAVYDGVCWIHEFVSLSNYSETNLQDNSYVFLEKPRGLPNLGNTCFMNSGLQCISQTPLFVDLLLRLDVDQHKLRTNGGISWDLLKAYKTLVEAINCQNDNSRDCVQRYKVQQYHDALANFCELYRDYRQLDAFESVSMLLDAIHDATKQGTCLQDELRQKHETHPVDFTMDLPDLSQQFQQISYKELDAKFKQEYSIVNKLFYGYYAVFEQCKSCCRCFFHLEPWKCVDLLLDSSARDFVDAFNALEMPQTRSVEEFEWCCPRCSSERGAAIWKRFFSLPSILMIHVSRAHLSTPFSKLNNPLQYPQTFRVTTVTGKQKEYENYGVCLHSGSTVRGGHYTAAIRRLHGDKWFVANDSRVRSNGPHAPSPDGREIALFYAAK